MKPLAALILAFVALLALAPAARAAPMAVPDLRTARLWGVEQGLMAGVTVAHAVQPLAVVTGDLPWTPKKFVAISGAVLYGATFTGLMFYQRPALKVAVIGPVVGSTTVFGGWILNKAGVIDLAIKPDVFQLAGGALQLPAAIIAVKLLREEPDEAASARQAAPMMVWRARF